MSFLRELITANLEDDQRRRNEEAAAEIEALKNEMTERESELRSQGQHELNVVRGEAARRHEEIMANLARAAEMRVAEHSRAASRAASIACESGVSVASTRARVAEESLRRQTIEFERMRRETEKRDREMTAILEQQREMAENLARQQAAALLEFERRAAAEREADRVRMEAVVAEEQRKSRVLQEMLEQVSRAPTPAGSAGPVVPRSVQAMAGSVGTADAVVSALVGTSSAGSADAALVLPVPKAAPVNRTTDPTATIRRRLPSPLQPVRGRDRAARLPIENVGRERVDPDVLQGSGGQPRIFGPSAGNFGSAEANLLLMSGTTTQTYTVQPPCTVTEINDESAAAATRTATRRPPSVPLEIVDDTATWGRYIGPAITSAPGHQAVTEGGGVGSADAYPLGSVGGSGFGGVGTADAPAPGGSSGPGAGGGWSSRPAPHR